jgi:hypothetical protein
MDILSASSALPERYDSAIMVRRINQRILRISTVARRLSGNTCYICSII